MKPIAIKYAQRDFTAARDEQGVPHIRAARWVDALYALGYLHALDRPTQMLFARVVAQGRSAELIADKPELRETDRFFRRAGLYLHLDREVRRLDVATLEQLNAYCHGVNDGLRQTGKSLPMWATRFRPEPWDTGSILLLGNLLNYGGLAIVQQQSERLLLELVQAGVPSDKLRELFSPLLDEADFDLLRRVRISSRLSDAALELLTDLPRLAGSNAWAVSPSRSRSGSSLLASDPHLEVNRLPAIWYEAALSWGEEYVLGATLPGCPLIPVGRTPRLAWGVTYLKGDTTDYFVEDCRLGPRGWQYRRADKWLDFEVRVETVRRRGRPDELLRILHNPQGTLDGNPDLAGPGLYLSSAWTGQHEGAGRSLATWLELVQCRDVTAAMDLVRECPQPTLCWVFADRAGHIGKQASGWFPRRRDGHTGLLPVPGWDDQNHWRGILPTQLLPRELDPPEGFVASANENINPPGGPQFTTLPVPDYRKRRIAERLAELTSATVEDMQALQYDVISIQARELLPILLPHLPDGRIKDRLSAWNCSYHPASTEATLFSRLYRNVLLEIFGQDPTTEGGIGWRRMLYLCTRVGFSMMVVTCIDRLLHGDESLWWRGRSKGELIRSAAERLKDERDAPWAVTNSFHFTNRYFENRLVGRALGFHTRALPMPGCHATPFQGQLLRAATRETTFAPSYHFVTDMGTDDAWTNLPGGPSESRFSAWYTTDLRRWRDGDYKRLTPVVEEEQESRDESRSSVSEQGSHEMQPGKAG